MATDWSNRDPDWISVREAVERGLAAVSSLDAEEVALEETLGRTLAADAVSPIDQPPWDNSAMDGYAARADDVRGASADAPVRLRVVDDIPAGGFPSRAIGPGEAVRIMTGAPVPEGADSAVRVEHTDAGEDVVEIRQDRDAGSNIRRRGEDLMAGAVALATGTAITPAAMGVLATIGVARPSVVRRPVVAILSNGDELAGLDEFDQVLAGRKIVNSNSYSLIGAVAALGCVPRPLGIARDDPADIGAKVEAALDADVLVTSAGAAVGQHDLVKDVLDDMGYEPSFWRVRMRPGSPASFGLIRRHGRASARPGEQPLWVWGLPGNPVSALVTFMVLVRPALRRLLGRTDVHEPVIRVRAAERIPSKPDKTHFQRIMLEPGDPFPLARPTGPQGSGILTSMTRADALAVIPEGQRGIEPGELVLAIGLAPADPAAPSYGLPDRFDPSIEA